MKVPDGLLPAPAILAAKSAFAQAWAVVASRLRPAAGVYHLINNAVPFCFFAGRASYGGAVRFY
jgi:hypothetical protein